MACAPFFPLEQMVKRQQAAFCGAVMSGAKSLPGINLYIASALPCQMSIMAAMDEIAPGTDRRKTALHEGHPIGVIRRLFQLQGGRGER